MHHLVNLDYIILEEVLVLTYMPEVTSKDHGRPTEPLKTVDSQLLCTSW
jgi:hypothetical protein